jgi:hypothetical protein
MKTIIALGVFCLALSTVVAQPTITWESPIDVSSEEFGNKCTRIALNQAGNPMVLHGKTGDNAGLYLSIMEDGIFGDPIQIISETNIYLVGESEGPRMAVYENRVAVSYQIFGQWATGAFVVISEDDGHTWGEPYAIAPNATEDHFMPHVAFNDEGLPWVALKLGVNPTEEGILHFNSALDSFDPAISGSIATPGVCECCPSNAFGHEGMYYNVVRTNGDNLRDFWLTASSDGVNWDNAIDIDETDWVINACPASGTSSTIMEDGTLISAYMSGLNGGRVYWSSVDLSAFTFLETGQIDPGNTSSENHPSISSSGEWLVATWERNSGGYNVMVAISDAGPQALEMSVVNVTEDLSGHNRYPSVVYDGEYIHLAYQNAMNGVVHYLKGEISGTSQVEGVELEENPWTISSNESGWVLRGEDASYTLYDLNGRTLEMGEFLNELRIPINIQPMILQLRSDNHVKSFKLVR